jgi:hypothetical protein
MGDTSLFATASGMGGGPAMLARAPGAAGAIPAAPAGAPAPAPAPAPATAGSTAAAAPHPPSVSQLVEALDGDIRRRRALSARAAAPRPVGIPRPPPLVAMLCLVLLLLLCSTAVLLCGMARCTGQLIAAVRTSLARPVPGPPALPQAGVLCDDVAYAACAASWSGSLPALRAARVHALVAAGRCEDALALLTVICQTSSGSLPAPLVLDGCQALIAVQRPRAVMDLIAGLDFSTLPSQECQQAVRLLGRAQEVARFQDRWQHASALPVATLPFAR